MTPAQRSCVFRSNVAFSDQLLDDEIVYETCRVVPARLPQSLASSRRTDAPAYHLSHVKGPLPARPRTRRAGTRRPLPGGAPAPTDPASVEVRLDDYAGAPAGGRSLGPHLFLLVPVLRRGDGLFDAPRRLARDAGAPPITRTRGRDAPPTDEGARAGPQEGGRRLCLCSSPCSRAGTGSAVAGWGPTDPASMEARVDD